MERKFLLLFLASLFCNLHASSEESPLLRDSSSSSSIFRHTDLPGPSYSLSSYLSGSASILTPEQMGQIQQANITSFQQELPVIIDRVRSSHLPEDCRLEFLASSDYKCQEKWIKKYGDPTSSDYFAAIDSAAKYAENHPEDWEDLRKKMIEEPCWLYRKTHSDTMNNRRLFFNEVSRRVEFRVGIRMLQLQNEFLMTQITELQTGKADLEQKLQEETRIRREESEALQNRLEEEIMKRSTLEQSLTEKKQSEEIPMVQESMLQELAPQIEKLQRQLEEFKASITLSNAELTRRIQALSEKVNAMDLDGIRAEVETLLAYIGIKKGEVASMSLVTKFDNMTHMILALYDLVKETPGLDYKILKRNYLERKNDASQK